MAEGKQNLVELYQRGGREEEKGRDMSIIIGEHVGVIMRIGGKLCRCK